MKKIFTLAISVAVAAMASVSCSSLMEKDINPGGNQVQFKTNISSFTTKADQSLNGFQSGDAIGVLAMEPIQRLNVKYTADGNKLVSDSPICWLDGQQENTEFMAYYPYDPDFNYLTEYSYNISVKTDQSVPENYHASDFLTAEGRAYPGETVKFEFTHLLSRVDLAVGGELAQKIVSVSLCGVGATYNVGGEGVSEPTSIKAAEITSGNKKFWSVIIVPQVATPTLEIVTSDGAKKTVSLNKEVDFQSGKRYQAELSLKADGSLEAEFVYRVFDWLNGDYVWFEAYLESWGVCGNFCDWNVDWAYEMDRQARGIYSIVMDLPEEAEFKFVKDRSWDDCFGSAVRGDDGEYRSAPLSIGQVVDLLPGGDGVNLYYPQGGRVRVVLNTIEKTAVFQPGNDWYIVCSDDKDEHETLFTYSGEGFNYLSERFYATAGTKFYLRNDNWMTYWSPSDAGYEYDDNGYNFKKVVYGEPMQLTRRSGVWLCFDKTGFVDLAFDAENIVLTVTECKDQTVTVEDVAKLPNGSAVSFESVTVYAASTEGYVVSTDGKTGLNVYVGLGNPVPAVGDVISLSGTKTVYCQLPELIDATFNVLSHSELGEVQYQAFSGNTELTTSIPVKLTGTLKVRPYSKQEVCLIETSRGLFRMHYLPEDYLKYYNSAIIVTGWYGGYANDYGYITITSMEGLTEKRMGAGTLKDPFDPVDAVLYSRSLAAGSESAEEVYIRGYVSELQEAYSTAVPAATFRISGGGNNLSECYFQINKAFFLEGKPWQLGNSTLNRYDEVVVCAKVCVNEDARTTSTVAENGYIYSLNGRTKETVDPVEYIGEGTAENPFNVPAAIAYTQALEPNAVSADDIYIKGKICGIREEFGDYYGNATFYISDSGESGVEFYAYRVKYLGNRKWRNDDTQIKKGDDVVICGKVVNYNGNVTETAGGQAYLYTLNGVTVEPVVSAITIDGDFSDWDALAPEAYSVAYSAPKPRLSALNVLKAYADDNALYVYIEYDTNQIRWERGYEHVPFHIFINSDNDKYTGGWDFGFKEPGIDFLVEGFLHDEGELKYADLGFFKWAGENTAPGWYWEEYANGCTEGAGNGYGAYEIMLDRSVFPLENSFSIGVDIQQNWDAVGLLPNDNVTSSNYLGESRLLNVNTYGPGEVIKPEEPEEEEPTYNGWSVIGSIQGHSWDYDIPMYRCYQTDGFYALIYYRDGEEFKIRQNGLWDVNRGIDGNGGTGGYNAVQGGPNIILPKTGVYEVFYYPNDEYIWIQEFAGESWGITGDIEGLGWEKDHIAAMAYPDDNLNPVVEFTTVRYNEGERFKIRFQGAWNLEYGLNADWTDDGTSMIEPGYTYSLRPGGSNISINQGGVYNVVFNMYDGLVKVDRLGDNKDITIPEISSLIAESGATSSSSAAAFSGFVEDVLVTYVNGSNAYLSGNGGNLLLYQRDHGLTEGDVISGFVAGSGYVYNALPEITSLGSWCKVNYNIGPVARDEVTLAELQSDYSSNLSRIVRLSGVTVTASSGRNGTIQQDGATIALYAQSTSVALPAANSIGNITAVVSTYKGNQQLGFWEDGWFEKTGEVEQTNPGGDETGSEDYSNKVVISTGSSSWYDGVATVNGVGNVPVLKFGTSSKFGDATLTVPAGTRTLTFYGFAWKGTTASLKFSFDGTESVVTVSSNDGVTGSSPYTINCSATDKITLDFGAAFTADTQVKVETFDNTGAAGKRAILFAIQPHAE